MRPHCRVSEADVEQSVLSWRSRRIAAPCFAYRARPYIGIADGTSIARGVDVPVLKMTASAESFPNGAQHVPMYARPVPLRPG